MVCLPIFIPFFIVGASGSSALRALFILSVYRVSLFWIIDRTYRPLCLRLLELLAYSNPRVCRGEALASLREACSTELRASSLDSGSIRYL